MEFRTKLVVDTRLRGFVEYNPGHPVVMLGSCFIDNMASRLERCLFDVEANPFGTLYNPLSIAEAAERLQSGVPFTADDLFRGPDGRYHSFMHHSAFSSSTPDGALTAMNEALARSHQAIKTAQSVIVTLGTAWVFSRNDTGRVVANCHKLPAREFTRRRLSIAETVEAIDRIRKAVAPAPLLLTVSPVRHAADGLHGNTLSKATLHLAVEESGADYFPAYEALIDDLRDYRFTATDMRHPSETACDYIFTLMCQALMSPQTANLLDKARRFTALADHRPLSAETANSHIEKINSEIDALGKEAPMLVEPARRYLNNHGI